jgi:hypothetical protein
VAAGIAIVAGVAPVRPEATVARIVEATAVEIVAQIVVETAAEAAIADAGVSNAGQAVAAEATNRIAGIADIPAVPGIRAGRN